jgi:hypothetical protein
MTETQNLSTLSASDLRLLLIRGCESLDRRDPQPLLARMELVRRQLCSIGLDPRHHDTLEKAADAICATVAGFRREFQGPPPDLQAGVLRKMGVKGWVGDDRARFRLVPMH